MFSFSRYLPNYDIKHIKTMSSEHRKIINREIVDFIETIASEFQYLHKELDNINMNTHTSSSSMNKSKESTQVQFYKIVLSSLLNV